MNLNLAMPYTDKCSPPQRPELCCYSLQAEDLLFTAPGTIEIVCQAGLRSVGLQWTLAHNMLTTPFRCGVAEALPMNRFRIRLSTDGLTPGFYDLRLSLDTGLDEPVPGICTFGYQADDLAIPQTRPADFSAFWEAAKATLETIPLDAQEEPLQTFTGEEVNAYNRQSACLPADYDPTGHVTDTVESGKVHFAGPDGGRVYGWLAKPQGPGPFPAMLVLPGGGFAARPRPLEHARHGYLALDIQVHGQDVDLPAYPEIPGHFSNMVYDPPAQYYYYHVHLRCLQAVRYLLSRPDVDPTRLVLVGGSQGGRLSVVTAGLEPRVRAIVPCIAHAANRPYLDWAEACNAAQSDGVTAAPDMPLDTPAARGFAYYDPMNYAPDIHCPVLMNCGLIDPVSPPTSVFAVYHRLGTTQKQMVALPGLAHDWSAEFDRRAWRWLEEIFRHG